MYILYVEMRINAKYVQFEYRPKLCIEMSRPNAV